MVIKKGSMREVINSVYQILINDEELLRLLWYLPIENTGKDPLDSTLENIKNMSNYWDIVDERIVLAEKVSDLESKELCRLYISSGRRRPRFDSYIMANQQIKIRIYAHETYLEDLRIDWISDRINELLSLERLDGVIGKLDYVTGNPYSAPIQYSCYEHVYEFTTSQK